MAALLLLAACKGKEGDAAGSATGSGTSSSDDDGSDGSGTTGTGGDSSEDDGLPGECIPWLQDCQNEDDKCMPWSLDPDRLPDEYTCCPVSQNTVPTGEECEIQDYDGSCTDDCEKGDMCVMDRPDTLQGFCHTFCDTTDPECGPDERCKSFFEQLESVPNVPLCMQECDPLIQDCERPGWSCLPDVLTSAGRSGFICNPPPPGNPYGLGEACLLGNDCEIGLLCISGDRVPGCESLNCCTTYCSNSEAEQGNDPCPAIDPAAVCVDWESPDPQWTDVGVCASPR